MRVFLLVCECLLVCLLGWCEIKLLFKSQNHQSVYCSIPIPWQLLSTVFGHSMIQFLKNCVQRISIFTLKIWGKITKSPTFQNRLNERSDLRELNTTELVVLCSLTGYPAQYDHVIDAYGHFEMTKMGILDTINHHITSSGYSIETLSIFL